MRAMFTDQLKAGADAAQIALAIVAALQAIEVALSPIIGRGGVAALYKRSLHLIAPAYPWLADTGVPIDFAVLKIVLVQQGSLNAAAGGNALLETFYELLTSLIGAALTERLLRSVWINSLSGSPAQDTSP